MSPVVREKEKFSRRRLRPRGVTVHAGMRPVSVERRSCIHVSVQQLDHQSAFWITELHNL